MFKLFGSKDRKASATKGAGAKKASAPPPVKMQRVNLAKRFRIIAETGQGSMSKVYRALDNQTGRSVCLKVQDAAKTKAAAGRASVSGRPPEGLIGAAIKHPNVVKTYDFGLTNKKAHWLTMEFIEGVSLGYVREAGGRDLGAKVDLLIQTAEGLAAIHKAGYIHHDFGPKNVLVTVDEVVKIIDFGLAVPNTPAFRRPGNRTGTLQYMAPELLRREPTDERLDIFSFGVTAFEFLTNRMPYDAADQMTMMRLRMNVDPMDIAKVDPRLPRELCDAIRGTLARKPAGRTKSMDAVIEGLKAVPVAAARDS